MGLCGNTINGIGRKSPERDGANYLEGDQAVVAVEMVLGFRTNHTFDPEFFAKRLARRESFALISSATQVRYGFMVNTLGEGFVQVTHCFTADQELPLSDATIMTLVCGEDGKIHVRPGWGQV